MTAFADVIGDPVAQSLSPAMQRFWIERLGLDARYEAVRVAGADIESFLAERAARPDWRGCNVTMPHKQAVIPFLARLDPAARRIGAVNTIVREEDGSLTGGNTDAEGFLQPLRSELAKPHLFRMARIFGTGGAARAIVTALAAEGLTIVLAGRTEEKARTLLRKLGLEEGNYPVSLSHFRDPTDFAFDDREGCLDLIVNATSLGMEGKPALPLHFSHIPPRSIVYDIVTHPVETPLLAEAAQRGLRRIDGLSMLIGQGAAAFARFFEVQPPRDDDAALRRMLAA